MMLAERLLVRVDLEQKREATINGVSIHLGKKYNHNFRESSPVVAIVDESKGIFLKGDLIVCHHNHFYGDSPFLVYDNLYSIPIDKSIFCKIEKDGELTPTCGNLICERVDKVSLFDLPPSTRKTYNDRLIVKTAGLGYAKGDQIFTEPQSDYEIIYVWGGDERRAIKVWEKDIVAVVK